MDFPFVPKSVLDVPENVEKLRGLVAWLESTRVKKEIIDARSAIFMAAPQNVEPKKTTPKMNWTKMLKL